MAHVLVIGASGGIGRETLSAALDAGHRVRAFSRSANEIDLENSYLKKHSGDAMNEAGIDAALDGIDVVVQTLGIGADELFKSVNLFSESTRVLLVAMHRREVRRLIAKAHRMRNQAMRDALVGFWGMLRRNIAVKRAAPVARHA